MAAQMRIEGTYTALVTPFRDDAEQSIDWEAFDALIEAQIVGGVAGLVPCGTTGEGTSLHHDEQLAVIKRTVERARGRVAVIAGTGSNSTRDTIEKSRAAEKAGANAVMLVVPYYNRPTQEGLYRHFVTAARAVSVPVVVYNIPARTGIDLLPETLAHIALDAPNIVATKEATGTVLRAQKLATMLGDRLAVLSGDDALTLPMIAVGGRGVISVTSNLLPAEVVQATRLALDGKLESARRAHLLLLPIHEAMFLEANPSPVKAALALMGRMLDVVRGPLEPATEGAKRALAATLEAYERAQRGAV